MATRFDATAPAFHDRLAHYLAAISDDMSEVEQTVLSADLLAGHQPARNTQISLQKIDHVQQRVMDLIALFEGMADGHLDEASLVGRLKLEETRGLVSSDQEWVQSRSGDLDLF